MKTVSPVCLDLTMYRAEMTVNMKLLPGNLATLANLDDEGLLAHLDATESRGKTTLQRAVRDDPVKTEHLVNKDNGDLQLVGLTVLSSLYIPR